jgi:hypothetical protein
MSMLQTQVGSRRAGVTPAGAVLKRSVPLRSPTPEFAPNRASLDSTAIPPLSEVRRAGYDSGLPFTFPQRGTPVYTLTIRFILTGFVLALLLTPSLATVADARRPTIQDKHAQEQRKSRKESERYSDADEREQSMRIKLKKFRQARRTMTKNGDDTTDIDEDIERLRRDSGIDDE